MTSSENDDIQRRNGLKYSYHLWRRGKLKENVENK